jgi:Zn-dependent protease/predicted transcriptional regulator
VKGAFKILTVWGIDLDIHITFLILPLFFWYLHGLRGLFIILAVFTSVAAHELTHSLVAKKFGIKVDKITLLPIGGIANMRSFPQTPRQEFMISISGPLFNIVLAILLYLPLKNILGPGVLMNPTLNSWPGAIAYAFWINPVLAGFNLLPAFPMDGGRVLRSILATRLSYKKATKIAVLFGYIFAVIFVFTALSAQPPNLILLLIALFIFQAASQEDSTAGLKDILDRVKVGDVLTEELYTLSSGANIEEALNIALHTNQKDFPVLSLDKSIIGFLTQENLATAVKSRELNRTVAELMIEDFACLESRDVLSKAYAKMENSGLRALPVIDNGVLKGVLSLEDISKVYTLYARKRGGN